MYHHDRSMSTTKMPRTNVLDDCTKTGCNSFVTAFRQSAKNRQKIAPNYHLAQYLEKNSTKTYYVHQYKNCTYAFDMGITAGVGSRHERKLRTTTPKLFYGRTIDTTADTISIHCLPEKVKQSRRGTRARDGQPDDQGDGRAERSLRPEHGRHPGRPGARRRPGHTPDRYSIVCLIQNGLSRSWSRS